MQKIWLDRWIGGFRVRIASLLNRRNFWIHDMTLRGIESLPHTLFSALVSASPLGARFVLQRIPRMCFASIAGLGFLCPSRENVKFAPILIISSYQHIAVIYLALVKHQIQK